MQFKRHEQARAAYLNLAFAPGADAVPGKKETLGDHISDRARLLRLPAWEVGGWTGGSCQEKEGMLWA